MQFVTALLESGLDYAGRPHSLFALCLPRLNTQTGPELLLRCVGLYTLGCTKCTTRTGPSFEETPVQVVLRSS